MSNVSYKEGRTAVFFGPDIVLNFYYMWNMCQSSHNIDYLSTVNLSISSNPYPQVFLALILVAH